MNRWTAVAVSLVACAGVARAQEMLTGTWQGETRNGASIVLTLSVKGTELTGTLTRNGDSSPLAEGKVSKNTFTFKATLNGQTEGFSGELVKDEIKIWLERQGASNAIFLRRATTRAAPSASASWANAF